MAELAAAATAHLRRIQNQPSVVKPYSASQKSATPHPDHSKFALRVNMHILATAPITVVGRNKLEWQAAFMTPTDALSDTSVVTPRLTRYIEKVREIVDAGMPPGLTVRLVGAQLVAHLGAADLLTAQQCAGHPDRYRQHLLHAERGFSVVALVWFPGQRTEIHDHLDWCVTGVHQGEEQEQRYSLVSDDTNALVATERIVNRQGAVCGFAPPGDIHRVWNGGNGKAVSLHIYGADITARGSSIRRVYDQDTDKS